MESETTNEEPQGLIPGPYSIEPYDQACVTCRKGRTWSIKNPDGVLGGTSYENEDDAADLCEDLNEAYRLGFEAGRKK